MVMKCPPKYGQSYDHKESISTTNWHLPRALPMTEEQRHLPSASMEIEPHAAIAVDLQQAQRELVQGGVRRSVLQGIWWDRSLDG